MHSSVLHVAAGSRASSWTVSAPGRAHSHSVLSALCDRAGTSYGVIGDDDGTSWAEWSTRNPVACLSDGLSFSSAPQTDARTAALHVRRGPDSGFFVSVPRGTWSCGRGESDIPLVDPFLSRTGATVLASPRSLTVDGAPLAGDVIRIGATELAAPPHPASSTSHSTAWPRRETPSHPQAPTWIAFAAPIVLGIVLAAVMRMWWFLLFSASAPLTAWLTWRVGIRRHRRDCAEAHRSHGRAARAAAAEVCAAAQRCLAAAESTVTSRSHVRIGRGRAALPVRVVFPDGRPQAGTGSDDCPGPPEITPEQVLPESAPNADRQRGREPDPLHVIAHDAPLFVEATAPLDVRGDAAAVDGAARSIAHQLLSQGRRVVGRGADRLPELTGWLTPASDARDGDSLLSLSSTDDCAVLRMRTVGTADDAAELTVETGGSPCISAVPGVDGAPALGTPLTGPADLHTISPATFTRLRGSAHGRRPDGEGDKAAPDLPDLLQLAAPRLLSAPIGAPSQSRAGERGDVLIADLAASGPHALVAGTTGSGKSVLLRTWISALMATHRADELRFVLLDFKGGAAFAPFAESAHTDALLTDLDSAGAARAVAAVRAEVTRRERVLAGSGSDDIGAHNRSGAARLPHLIVVIDELHVIAASDPAVIADIESLTALGRSLGIHLILATQRPAGVITAQMRANISLRICLRVRDESESRDVIDAPDAATLPASAPGAAIIADSSGRRRFRCAMPAARDTAITIRRIAGDAPPVRIPLELDNVVDGLPRGGPRHDVVLPPLPEELTDGWPTALGVADRPDIAAQPIWEIRACGSAVLVGGRGTGKTSALARIAEAAAADGETVVVISSAAGSPVRNDSRLPRTDPRGFLTLSPSSLWALDYVIRGSTAHDGPVRWVIDDWASLTASPETAAPMRDLEEALTSGRCGRFAVSAHRRFLSQPIGATADTRLLFCPTDPDDAVYFGLPRGRFPAHMPPGRAVLRAPGFAAGRSGADIHMALPSAPLRSGDAATKTDHPLWTGFLPRSDAADAHPAGSLIGHGPRGEAMRWATGHSDAVLVVRAPSTAEAAACADEWAAAVGGCPILHDPTGADAATLSECLQTSAPCIVAMPFHRTGRPTPFDRGNDLGPVVLIGARTEAELLAGGRRGLGVLPALESTEGKAGRLRLAWFITHNSATPVRLAHGRAS